MRKVLEIKKPYGFSKYLYICNKKYPNGLVVGMGSYVNDEYRGKGYFKEMLNEILSLYPNATFQYPLKNRKLVKYFYNLGFKKVKTIEYWGQLSNCVLVEKIGNTHSMVGNMP